MSQNQAHSFSLEGQLGLITGGGTGLGLSIAKAIVEGMNGRIGFQNGSPDGTVFYFELPLVSASEAASR